MAFARPRRDSRPEPQPEGRTFVPVGRQGRPYEDGWSLNRAVDLGMGRSIPVMRSVIAQAVNASKLPAVVRRGDFFEGEIVTDKRYRPFLHLLNRKASKWQPAIAFRRRVTMLQILNRQGVFLHKLYSRGGDLLALKVLPPGHTFPVPDENDFVSAFEVRWPGGYVEPVPANQVIWIREPHPIDPYAGWSPLEAAGLSIELDYYARAYQRNFLLNDGRPGGILVVKGSMDPDDKDDLRFQFGGAPGAGIGGAGRVAVVDSEGGADWVDTAVTPRDAQYTDARRAAIADELAAFGSPESVVLGNASGRTYDNADAELEIWWREVLVPLLEIQGAAFHDVLDEIDPGAEDDDLFVSFDWSRVPVLSRDKRAREQFHLQEFLGQAITVDEYREVTGRGPMPKAEQPPSDQPAQNGQAEDWSQDPTVGTDPLGGAAGAGDPFAVDPSTASAQALLDEAKAAADTGGVMIALTPPADIAERLAVPGGEPAERLHITLAYLAAPAADLDDTDQARLVGLVAGLVSSASPITCRVSGAGTFTADDGAVRWCSIDAPGLAELASRLRRLLDENGFDVRAEHGFQPHMTLAYAASVEVAEAVAFPAEAGWVASAVDVYVGGDRTRVEFDGGRVELKALEGGADRNRGDAEKLRHYWTHGPGAAKIRWGTDGDWTRCVEHLGKYLGLRARGYCSLRHHEVLGYWPGDRGKPGNPPAHHLAHAAGKDDGSVSDEQLAAWAWALEQLPKLQHVAASLGDDAVRQLLDETESEEEWVATLDALVRACGDR